MSIKNCKNASPKNQSVKFEPGEFITQIDFPFAIKTSEGYISEENGKKHWKITRNRTRTDLVNMDALLGGHPVSPYHVYHQFQFNLSLWVIPMDMAVVVEHDSHFGISNGTDFYMQNYYYQMNFHLMKLVIGEQCWLGAGNYLDVNQCQLKWELVAPAIFNWILANGTTVTQYFIPQGYHDFIDYDKFYTVFEWHSDPKNTSKVANVLEKFEMLWEHAEKPQNYKLFDGKRIVDTNYASTTKVLLQPHETDFGSAPKEWADVGVMVPVLDCTYGDAIMGIAKYEPKFVHGRKVKPKFDWTNKFFHGCEHRLEALSEKSVPLHLRKRPIGFGAVEHKVDFFVGLTAKSLEKAFKFTSEQIREFKKFDAFVRSYQRAGQYILDPERFFNGFYKYELKAKFVKFVKEMLEEMGFTEEMLHDWRNIHAKFGIYQEVYDCPDMMFYMPRVSGLVKFTSPGDQGDQEAQFFGYPLTKENMVESYVLINLEIGQKCRVEVGFTNRKPVLTCENIFLGCEHQMEALSENTVPLELRKRPIGMDPATHKVDFFVGLTAKSFEKPFNFTKENMEEFKEFDASFKIANNHSGQTILNASQFFDGFHKYELKATFVKFDEEMLVKMGFTEEMLKNWQNIDANFGIYQEVYDCLNMKFYMPRVLAMANFTMPDKEGEPNVLTFGFPWTNHSMVDSYFVTDLSVGDKKCQVRVGFENLKEQLLCEDYFHGCEHRLEALSEKTVPHKLRQHPIGVDPKEYVHTVDFFVGLTVKSFEKPFNFTRKEIEKFKKFDENYYSKYGKHYGQVILRDHKFFQGFYKYQLKATFVKFNETYLKKMRIEPELLDDWRNLYGTYGIFQEVYDCPKMKFYMNRITGLVNFTMPADANGDQETRTYGVPWTSHNMVDLYTLMDTASGVRCQVNVKFTDTGYWLDECKAN